MLKKSDFIDSLSRLLIFFIVKQKFAFVLLLSPFERNFFNAKERTGRRFAAFPLAVAIRVPHLPTTGLVFPL